jgi:hypothetical protein
VAIVSDHQTPHAGCLHVEWVKLIAGAACRPSNHPICTMRSIPHSTSMNAGHRTTPASTTGDSGMWLAWIIGFVIWVAIAFWPARVADRKGHSFFGYFLLSLLFFPLALIMAYMVSDRTPADSALY